MNEMNLPVDLSALRPGGLARLAGMDRRDGGGPQAERLRDAALRFETVLVQKLMDTMRETIPDSGLTDDAASKQMWDLFYMHLGDLVGRQGGLGVWKQLAGSLEEASAEALKDGGELELER